jgi:hypothetical protein
VKFVPGAPRTESRANFSYLHHGIPLMSKNYTRFDFHPCGIVSIVYMMCKFGVREQSQFGIRRPFYSSHPLDRPVIGRMRHLAGNLLTRCARLEATVPLICSSVNIRF